jgi:amidase
VKGLRVAVWLDEPGASIDESIRAPIHDAAIALHRAGAKVDFAARPNFDPQGANDTYLTLLMAQISARRPDFERLLDERAKLGPGDQSPRAVLLRKSTASYREFSEASNQRERLRWAWRDFFDKHDVMLAPITATAAFVHDHTEPPRARTMLVNGKSVPYFSQLFWAGLATCSYLPATVAPIGFTTAKLPVGLQIIGAEMTDRTTIWAAAQLAKLVGGYASPPDAD